MDELQRKRKNLLLKKEKVGKKVKFSYLFSFLGLTKR